MSEILFNGAQVIFATDNPTTALRYLKKAMPQRDITQESAKPILDLVKAGIIRIGDPDMHKEFPVFPGENYDVSALEIIKAWHTEAP